MKATQISKNQAETLYYSGIEIILTPSKCGVGSMFQATVQRNTGYCSEENFNKIVNAFHYYNCNNETGKGINYYTTSTPPVIQTTTVEKVKKGDYFRLPNKQTVYVADGYNRSTRKYSFYKFDDINAFQERKKGTIVETDFDF